MLQSKRYIIEVFGKDVGVLIEENGHYIFHAAMPEVRSLNRHVFRNLQQAEQTVAEVFQLKQKPMMPPRS